ncbi:MAG: esterase/lipase family protein [Pyrinomonadaceae bacterium]
MKRNRFRGRRILCVMFFTSLMSSMVFGQAPRGSKTAANSPKCSGGWSGTIRYTRTQSKTDDKTVDRVSARGKDTRHWEMRYRYKALVAVLDRPDGSSDGKATIEHSMTSDETVEAVEKNSCDRGKTWRDMRGTSTSKTETVGNAEGESANVNVGVNQDGTYTVSVALPQIKGKVKGEQKSSYSGQCTPKDGKTLTMPESDTTLDGNSLTSNGKDRIDASNPNKLSGSFSQTWQDVTETITWNLEKCGAPLRITDVAFEDMKFPTWNDWGEITEQAGTIDGNLVKIKATVLNDSGETKYADVKFKETYKGDKWDGARPDAMLNDSIVSVRVEPNSARDVEIIWDSSGYAWYDDGRPRMVQRIKAELEENSKKIDEETKNLKVGPKPVILLHGLWGNSHQFETWQNIFTTSHSYDWKAFTVGEKPENGELKTGGTVSNPQPGLSAEENAQQLKRYIEYAQKERNAWHVDVIGHSTGGLIARSYVNSLMPDVPDGRPQIAHLLTLGTPHLGSKCADIAYLASSNPAVQTATSEYAEEFNKRTINRKGVKFSALAGDSLPTICKGLSWGDGFVTVESAAGNIADVAKTKSIHTDLMSTKDFSDFVKPRLAIGPKGNHNPDFPAIPVNQNSK